MSREHLHGAGAVYAAAAVLDDRTVGETRDGEKIWCVAAAGAKVSA